MKFGVRKLESCGEEIMPLAFFVLTQYQRVTDRQTDRRTDGHVAITITRARIGGTAAAAPPPSGLATLLSVGAVP